MRFLALIVVAVLSGLLAGCEERPRPVYSPEHPVPITVPLSAVIADPERYDGELIRTDGVLATGAYDWQLYVTRQDYEGFMSLNGVALDVYGQGSDLDPAFERLEGSAVSIVGVFSDGVSGHMSLDRGLLVVKSVREIPSRRQLTMLHELTVPWEGVPWLWIMAVLIGSTAAAWSLRGRLWRGVLERRATLALAVAMSLFTVTEVKLAIDVLPSGLPDPPEAMPIYAFILAAGVIGLVLMWRSWRRSSAALMVAMMALQLAGPIVRELLRTDTWPSQLVFPFAPDVARGDWERPDWPPDPMPEAMPRSEMGEPELPPRTQADAGDDPAAAS